MGDGRGGRRPGAVLVLPAAGPDVSAQRRPRGTGAAGLGHAAWQPAAARLVAGRRLLLHRRTSAEHDHRGDRRAAAGRDTHPRGADLHGGGAADRVAGQGQRTRPGRRRAGIARRGHPARALAGAGDAGADAGTGPPGHRGTHPAGAAGARPGAGTLVGARGGGRAADPGAGQRRARHVRRRRGGGGGLRRAGRPGDRPPPAPAEIRGIRPLPWLGRGHLHRAGAPGPLGDQCGRRLLHAPAEKWPGLGADLRTAGPCRGRWSTTC